MRLSPARFSTVALLLLACCSAAWTQSAPSSVAYNGPRYPGGPDSLRALIYRSSHLATPAPAGRMLVRFELQPNGQAHNLTRVQPVGKLDPALVNASTAALNYLEAHMAAWQLGPDDLKNPNAAPKISLALDFTTSQATQPYSYTDEYPTFPDLEAARGRKNKPSQGFTAGTPANLISHIQRHSMYPSLALRLRQQGIVYAYFEVAENGAIEHTNIIGTQGPVGNELAAEVLRTVALLPAATKPAAVAGRSVRICYTLPIVFVTR